MCGSKRALLIAILASLPLPAAADRLDVTATTFLAGRTQAFDGEAHSVVPVLELLHLRAGGMKSKLVDGLRVELSAWGGAELGNPRDGQRAVGDVDVGYLEGSLLDRKLEIRAGRQLVTGGAARLAHIDGGAATVRAWKGLTVQGWTGVLVRPEFGERLGDLAAGGRASWRGAFGTEGGVSFVRLLDDGRVAHQNLGGDLRWQATPKLSLFGFGVLSTLESRIVELDGRAHYQVSQDLELGVQARRTSPDLFLSRTSILSVFAETSRDQAGAFAYLRPCKHVDVDADASAVVLEDGTGFDGGARVQTRLGWAGQTLLGAEGRVLHIPSDGYLRGRLFARQRFDHGLSLTGDVDWYRLEEARNGTHRALLANASLAWQFAGKWQAVATGMAGMSPSMDRRFEAMARLAYNWSRTFSEETK